MPPWLLRLISLAGMIALYAAWASHGMLWSLPAPAPAHGDLLTPAHVAPPIQSLPLYAMLRATTGDLVIPWTQVVVLDAKTAGFATVIAALAAPSALVAFDWSRFGPWTLGGLAVVFWALVVVLGVLGALAPEPGVLRAAQIATAGWFGFFWVVAPAAAMRARASTPAPPA